MLSGETAAGQHPVETVNVMNRIILAAEADYNRYYRRPTEKDVHNRFPQVTDAISETAARLAENVEATAIACLTHSGRTARSIARFRPAPPICAFTDDARVVGQLGLLWGTKTFHIPFQTDTDAGINQVKKVLLENGLAEAGDRIVVTAGMPLPGMGQSNLVHVAKL
jgi:pyruvate kinase